MEGIFMNGLWKKRIPAFLLTLVMIISLMPTALAEEPAATPDAGSTTVTPRENDPDDTTGGGDSGNPGGTHSHVWGGWVTSKEATCTVSGLKIRTCTAPDCNQSEEEPIPETGAHKWVVKSTTATCGAAGTKTEECSECSQEKTSADPATGKHSWQNTGTPTAATCGKPGVQPQVCQTCGNTRNETIPATGNHSWETVTVTQASCTGAGAEYKICKVCKEETKPTATPALGHTAPNAAGKCTRCGVTIQTHTHQKTGGIQSDATRHWYNCAGCSERLEEAVHGPANAGGKCPTCGYTLHTHSWAKDWTTNATSHWHACTGSSCTVKNQEAAHAFVNNVCSVCSYVRSAGTFTVRFYNGNSVVNTQNVTQGGYPTVPTAPAKSGYTFRGWVAYNPSNALWTTGTITVNPAAVAISRATDYYAIFSAAATGQNATISATPNIGSTLSAEISRKCSAFGVVPSVINFSPASSNYGSLYTSSTQSDSYLVRANYDYMLSEISFMTFRSGSYGGYPLGYVAKDSSGQNTVRGTITIGGTSYSNLIEYTVSAGRSKSFSRSDFLDAYRRAVGNGASLYYVVFSAPSDYNDYGTVTSGSKSFTKNNLSDYKFYYSDPRSGEYALDSVAFKADSNARAGKLTLGFTAYGNGSNVSGTVEITIAGTAKGDVTYNVEPGKQRTFDASDFNKAFQRAYGSNREDIDYVVFNAPTSYDSFRGQLQVNRTSFDRKDLNSTKFYYSSSRYGEYSLDRLSFQAESKAKEGDNISIPFQAYYGTGYNDYENCTLVINIGDGVVGSGDINYDVAPGKSVDFKAKDFNNFFKDAYSGYNLSYVEFEQPDTSAFSQGTLYHNYGISSSKSFTRTTLDDYEFYYSPGNKDYGIGNLTFVANNNFKDTVTLEFTAYGSGDRSVRGTVSIRSTEHANDGDLNYTVTPGKSVDFQRTAFNTFFRKKYNSTVSYVIFDRPTDSNVFSNGTLYCDYGTSAQTSFSRSDLGGTRFYYDKGNVGRNDYYLDELTFVADRTFKNPITLTFTAYGEYDDDYVEGELVIKADGSSSITSNYSGSIRYTTTTGVNVQINANDVARYYKRSYPSYNLQYVVLGGIPAAGNLYYNYYNASSYGSTSRTQITSANYGGQSFYLSPSAGQFALTELTYVPSGSNYCASIPFTAYGTGGAGVSGTILISVSRTAVSEVYGVTPRNTAVNFPAAQVYSAVLAATGSALNGIQLLNLPAVSAGTLYLGTGSTRADTTTVYTYAAGANQMSQLRFVPSASYTGSVEIPYVALDANGAALASGTFSLGVLNSRKTLKDVNSSTWCYKYVMELTDQNVISGYTDGSFKPNSTVTYGAALKLIMLAAGYPEQAPTGKNVFSGYLSRAQADGIVTRSNVNLSTPITRLQVAQIAAGALKLSTSGLSSVRPFTDTADVYVQALNAAGIVEGYFSNGTSTFRPSATLNRGQMSAIVWRMNQYRK